MAHAISRMCSVDGCARPSRKRGWCGMHYQRWQMHGDPSVTETPERGMALAFFREVVLPYEGDECLIWPFWRGTDGYGRVNIDGQVCIVSRLACEEANGPAPTPDHQAAHSCGKGKSGCVSKRHLAWKTQSENEADKLIHGTHNRGVRHPQAKLTEEHVREIRRLSGQTKQSEIADRYGVTFQTISAIVCGRKWAWLQ